MKDRSHTIYIGGVKYTIKPVDKIKKPPGRYGKNIQIFGQFRPKNREIVYIRRLGKNKGITIIHEIIHAITFEFGGHISEDSVDTMARELFGSLSQIGIIK